MSARALALPTIPRHGAWWLPALGWFCLTLPAPAWSALFDAIRASAHFSHQARLAADVAALLHAPAKPASTAAASAPAPAKAPAAAEFAFVKFTLPRPMSDAIRLGPPARRRRPAVAWLLPDRIVGDVPCPPPRTA